MLMTLGGSGMHSITVVLPAMQADFGVTRGDASLPYTLTRSRTAAGHPAAAT